MAEIAASLIITTRTAVTNAVVYFMNTITESFVGKTVRYLANKVSPKKNITFDSSNKLRILRDKANLKNTITKLVDEALLAIEKYHSSANVQHSDRSETKAINTCIKSLLCDKNVLEKIKEREIVGFNILMGITLKFVTTLFYLIENKPRDSLIVKLLQPILEKAIDINLSTNDTAIPSYQQIQTQIEEYIPNRINIDEFDKKPGYLGEGSYGEVYKAFWHKQSEPLALKTYKESMTLSDLFYEYSILIKLKKTGVAPEVYGFVSSNNLPEYALAMEYAGKMNLYDLITQNTRQAKQAFAHRGSIILQVFLALKALHEISYSHGDIKLQNFVIKIHHDRVEVKIIDFGHSVPFGTDQPFNGTELYAPPEVKDPKHPTTPEADIFAATRAMIEILMFFPLVLEIATKFSNELKWKFQDKPKKNIEIKARMQQTLSESIHTEKIGNYYRKNPFPKKIARMLRRGMEESPDKRASAEKMAKMVNKPAMQEMISDYEANVTPILGA